MTAVFSSFPTVCSASSPVNFPENNMVNDVVATISIQSGVTLTIESPLEGPFRIQENQLIVTEVLDYEVLWVMTNSASCVNL